MQSVFQSRKPVRTIRRRPRTQTGQGIVKNIKNYVSNLKNGLRDFFTPWGQIELMYRNARAVNDAKREERDRHQMLMNNPHYGKPGSYADTLRGGKRRRKRAVRRRR